MMDYQLSEIVHLNAVSSIATARTRGDRNCKKWVIKWLYGARTDADAAPILAEARARRLRVVADPDARPIGSAQPEGALWDDGSDSVAELRRMMTVRRVALDRFGTSAINANQSLADLRRA